MDNLLTLETKIKKAQGMEAIKSSKEHAKKVTCPAKDQVCRRCDKRGHFRKMCRAEFSVRDIDTTEEQSKFLRAIHVDTADANTSSPWVTPININNGVISFKIDTGVDITVI